MSEKTMSLSGKEEQELVFKEFDIHIDENASNYNRVLRNELKEQETVFQKEQNPESLEDRDVIEQFYSELFRTQ